MNIITLEADARKYFILQRLKPTLATSGGSSLQSLALLRLLCIYRCHILLAAIEYVGNVSRQSI